MTYIFLETGKPATSEAVFIKTLIENLGYNISSNTSIPQHFFL